MGQNPTIKYKRRIPLSMFLCVVRSASPTPASRVPTAPGPRRNPPPATPPMIDQFAVFSKSGLVLWAKEKYQLNGAPVEKLVQSVLLEGRSSDAQFECDAYNVKWSFVNELDLVFGNVEEWFMWDPIANWATVFSEQDAQVGC